MTRPRPSCLGSSQPPAAPAGRGGRNRACARPPHLRRCHAPGAPGGLRSGSWGWACARGAPPCAGSSASASAASASATAPAAAAIHCGPGRCSRAPSKRTPRRSRAGKRRPRPRLSTAPWALPPGPASGAPSASLLTASGSSLLRPLGGLASTVPWFCRLTGSNSCPSIF